MPIPKAGSPGEESFALHCRAENIRVTREYEFFPGRKWRFDFAFLDDKIAVEIEGGVFSYGGHSRGKGYEKDCEKYNTAVIMGWRVLRYTTDMVMRGDAINDLLEILASQSST